MKRVDLTPEQLENVVKLRQGGLSWLKIQDETGISRRVAQRAYEQWEKLRSIRELENVRLKVGEIEFEKHLDALTFWSESLTDHLSLPMYPYFLTDAEAYFETLMLRDIPKSSREQIPPAREDKVVERKIRRNRLLFQSLKEHTVDKIQWSLLDDWKEGWDTCYRIYPRVAAAIEEVVGNALDEIPGFDAMTGTGREPNKPSQIFSQGTGDILWSAMLHGDMAVAADRLKTMNEKELPSITFSSRSILVRKKNQEIPLSLVDLCLDQVDKLWDRDDTKVIREAVDQMRGAVEELESKLDTLVLRPHILRTRCRLCPA